MKKSADVLDLTVITLAEGIKAGKVREVVIDTDSRAVAGFLIQSGDWFKINGLPFSSVTSIGDDAIIVANADAIIDASQMEQMESLLSKHVPLKDCTIFSKAGRVIGTVTEVLFNPDNGKLISLQIQSPEGTAIEDVPIDAVVTFGQNILIIDQDKKKLIDEQPEEISYEEVAAPEVEPEPEAAGIVSEENEEAEYEQAPEVAKEEPETPSAGEFDIAEHFEGVEIEEAELDREVDEEAIGEVEAEVAPDVEAAPEIETQLEAEEQPEVEEIEIIEEAPAEEETTIIEEQPQVETKEEAKEEESNLGDLFAKRQVQLLKGKLLSRDIVTDGGQVIANAGQEVNDTIIKEAIDNKKLVELMVSVQSRD